MKAQGLSILLMGLALWGCGGNDGRFRLKGSFEHLEQGEFYIYSTDGGTTALDTIPITKGRFTYDVALSAPATFHLLYPNLSQQVIFAEPGNTVRVKGDAQDLQSVRVKGGKANRALTRFRLDNLGNTATQMQQAAEAFILKNPTSPAAAYIYKEYLLTQDATPVTTLQALYDTLRHAQPDNIRLRTWQPDVSRRKHMLQPGDTIPPFSLILRDSTTLTAGQCKGRPLIINFWASWESRSVADMFQMKKLTKQHGNRITVLSISLDTSSTSLKGIERMDTVTWPSYCDFKAWMSPAVQFFAIPAVPYFIVADTAGHIILTGSSYLKEIEPQLKNILPSR